MASHALRTPVNDGLLCQATSAARIRRGRDILDYEGLALCQLATRLDETFAEAVDVVLNCQGAVVVSGMGKAGLVGQKLSASLASTGTPSHFLHPAEAVHGDLGRVRAADVVLVLSYSGETEEVLRILPHLKDTASAIIAITARATSSLGRLATLTLPVGECLEAGVDGLAPSTTTTAMLALGDALTLVVSEQRGFTRNQFARYHPAGNLGRQLAGVCECMRPLTECRIADQSLSLREVLVQVSRPGRRTGVIMLTNDSGQLVGIFTDSDLARLLERSQESQLDQAISQVMTRAFTTVTSDCLMVEAVRKMVERKLSELPVVDERQMPVGVVDVTDIVHVEIAETLDRSDDSASRLAGVTSSRPVLRIVRDSN
jgi:arabinose-5-phosphate isomerase